MLASSSLRKCALIVPVELLVLTDLLLLLLCPFFDRLLHLPLQGFPLIHGSLRVLRVVTLVDLLLVLLVILHLLVHRLPFPKRLQS